MEVILKSIDPKANKVGFCANEQQTPHFASFQEGFQGFCSSICVALGADRVNLFYFDEEGDKIFVGSESELAEASHHLQAHTPEASLETPEAKTCAPVNEAKLEKLRQVKRGKLMKRNEALETRIEFLGKRIKELQEKRGELEELKETVRQELENLESAGEGELKDVLVPCPKGQKTNQQKREGQEERQLVQLRQQRQKILERLEVSAKCPKMKGRPRDNLEKRLQSVSERIATIENRRCEAGSSSSSSPLSP